VHPSAKRMTLRAPASLTIPSWAQERLLYCTVRSAGPRAHVRGGVEWVVAERGREGERRGEVQIGRTTPPPPPPPVSLLVQPTHAPTHTHISSMRGVARPELFLCVSSPIYACTSYVSVVCPWLLCLPIESSPLLSDIYVLITMTGLGHPHTHHALIGVCGAGPALCSPTNGVQSSSPIPL
jgi:hypothetical protein